MKMVHNGIEYGLMAAYAEGLNVLAKANIGADDHAARTPRPHRSPTRSTTGTTSTSPPITEVWRRGSVVASWLLDLTADALARRSAARRRTRAASATRGEGRWTIHAAIDEGVPVPVLSAALFERFSSRGTRRRRRQGAVGDARRVRRPRRARSDGEPRR